MNSNGRLLTKVSIHGSQYGGATVPDEDFKLYLCDEGLKEIALFRFPYGRFERGAAAWVQLDVPPTQVPRRFIICVSFSPTARKGIFVDHDGTPGNTSASDGDRRLWTPMTLVITIADLNRSPLDTEGMP